MVAYLSRYISNFSSRCKPLWKLTKVNAKFEWSTEQEKAFKDLKAAITAAQVLIPYHPEHETLIICDRSPAGLGGGLLQRTGKGFQPVHYVRRTLTDTEKRYSQIKREAIAAEFTTTRLQMYLLGTPKFKLATDHEPLLPLMNNPTTTSNTDWKTRPGKTNMSYVIAAVQSEHAVVLDKIKEETAKQRELTQLPAAMKTSKWTKTDPDLKPYFDLRAKLYMTGGLILRTDRIIPPESLRDRIIQIAHKQGHLGISKNKPKVLVSGHQLLHWLRREHLLWLPDGNKHTAYRTSQNAETAWETLGNWWNRLPWTIPKQRVHTGHNQPILQIPRGWVRLLDSHQASTEEAKESLRHSRSPQDSPVRQWTTVQLRRLQRICSRNKKITPRRPKAQGQVEGFNKLMNKTAAIAHAEGIDLHEATYDML